MQETRNTQNVKNSRDENLLFLKRWLRHPLRLGAVLPSSPALTSLIARNVNLRTDSIAVELGAGTGCVTRMLLQAGIPTEKLYVLELDPELCEFLKASLPNVNVIQGDARELPKLLPKKFIGKVSSVISGMPMTAMPQDVQRQIIDASFEVMDQTGEFLQYTYRPGISPLRAKNFGLEKQRIGMAFRNLPPATVWRYQRAA